MSKRISLLILTIGLISVTLGATIAWLYDVELISGNIFQAGIWDQPCLWIWRHGAKVWPEWQVGYYNETQVLYARIVNDGNQSVYVRVEFIIYGPLGPENVESSIALCDGTPPGNTTVSAEYHPTSPGTFYFQAILYYSFDTINWKPWSEVQDALGGEGVSKTASSKFKVHT